MHRALSLLLFVVATTVAAPAFGQQRACVSLRLLKSSAHEFSSPCSSFIFRSVNHFARAKRHVAVSFSV